ncbi:SDR family oxidoreductase [Alkalihalobacillus sp. NPDC078783]
MLNIMVIGSEGMLGQAFQKDCSIGYRLLCIDKEINEPELNQHLWKFSCDITSSTDLDTTYKLIKNKGISIDGLVYLAGINPMKNFFNSTTESWNKTFDLNITGFMNCLKRFYDLFSDQVSIVCVASQNGIVGHENRICYGPSKAAIIQLVRNLSVDFSTYSDKDIKVNCVSPGYVLTEKNKDYFDTFSGKKLLNRNPYKRLVKTNDVINAINFLLSDQSIAIRGQNLVVDYGYTMI